VNFIAPGVKNDQILIKNGSGLIYHYSIELTTSLPMVKKLAPEEKEFFCLVCFFAFCCSFCFSFADNRKQKRNRKPPQSPGRLFQRSVVGSLIVQ
jgi:hypothetical protein